MKLSLGAQLDQALSRQAEANREVERVRELILLETRPPIPGLQFTYCERRVLNAINRNLQNKEIASEIGCSVRTVKFHVSNLLAKTGCVNRLELMRSTINDDQIQISNTSIDVVPIRAAR